MRDGEALFYQAPGGSPIVWTTFRSGLTFYLSAAWALWRLGPPPAAPRRPALAVGGTVIAGVLLLVGLVTSRQPRWA